MATTILISDFLHRIKRPIVLEPSNKYKLVTIKMKHKGVVLRQEKLGSEIKSNMYEVKAGDFILSGIDARNGAFGIVPPELDGAVVTNDFWYFDIDESLIDKSLFLELTSTTWFDEICRKGSDGTTQRIRLQKTKFFNQEIIIPDRKEQFDLVLKYKNLKKINIFLYEELSKQQANIKKLRQQILQDTIEGKITADWRKNNKNVENANKLLERIKKDKKIDAFTALKKGEVFFNLPDSWQWCHIAQVGIVNRGKSPKYDKKGTERILNQKCVRWFFVDTKHCKTVSLDWCNSLSPDAKTQECDILVNSTGEGTIGRSAIVDKKSADLLFDSHVLRLRSYVEPHYIISLINSDFGQSQINDLKGAKSTKQTELGVNNLSNLIIPLPPVEEQREIVSRVNKLLAICDQLEAQITLNQERSDQFMQAVLKEAFTQREDTSQDTDDVIELRPLNTKQADFYKRTLLAAEIVDQLHKELTFGHLKLQKIIFLCQKTQNMQLPTNFLQQAAGPYDPQMARSLDKQLKDNQWYDYNGSATLKYQPLDKAGSHKNDFQKYFQNNLNGIKNLIGLFKTKKSNEIEAVATLYACWEEILNSGVSFSKEALIKKFFAWSEEKRKFSERQLNQVITWMEKHGIVPKVISQL